MAGGGTEGCSRPSLLHPAAAALLADNQEVAYPAYPAAAYPVAAWRCESVGNERVG